MPNAAFVLAAHVPVPAALPGEPPRITPYDQAVEDYDPESDAPWPEKADYPDPFGDQPPRDAALHRLLSYRGISFKPVKHAGGVAFLAHSSKPDAFDLERQAEGELARLHDIAHAYGGDHLALWTFGQAVHLWAARSPAPGTPPRAMKVSVRIDAPGDAGRPDTTAERILAWMDGSPIAPDADALRRALQGPVLSVPAWFAAFGVRGAKDVQAPDADAAWSAFEQVAHALLTGDTPDAALRRQVNALVDDRRGQLPAKPGKRGATARVVTTAFLELRDTLGEPASPRLAACASAAKLYDRITSGPAGDRLLQTRDKPLAVSLALGRLIAHYPVAVRRDPIFLALAAHDAEVWNGHAFVEPFEELAERGGAAGFTIAIVPESLEAAFREAHDVRADESAARDGWAGEAAIDVRGVAGKSVVSFTKWFTKARADGAIVRAESDGACRVLRFAKGRMVEDAPKEDAALRDAARALDPRGIALAAGFPDVLAPGALAEEFREATTEGEPIMSRDALAARLDTGGATAVGSLLDHAWPAHDAPISMLVRPATRDEGYATAIARDLRAAGESGSRPRVARSGTEIWVDTSFTPLDAPRIARLLGDLPAGSTAAVARGEAVTLLRVAPELPAPRPTPTTPAAGWVPPRVVLEEDDKVFATADLARLAWGREEALEMGKQLARRYPGRVAKRKEVAATDALAILDESLRAHGFVALGDLLASHLYGFALRAYTHADGFSTAIVVIAPGHPLVECEFQTRLAGGTEVNTTSLNPGSSAKPGASIRRASVGVDELWKAHEKHVAEVRGGRELEAAPTTLEGFARLLAG